MGDHPDRRPREAGKAMGGHGLQVLHVRTQCRVQGRNREDRATDRFLRNRSQAMRRRGFLSSLAAVAVASVVPVVPQSPSGFTYAAAIDPAFDAGGDITVWTFAWRDDHSGKWVHQTTTSEELANWMRDRLHSEGSIPETIQ